ncbi:heavy-metal-associated domain-containing protein [Sandaracinobacter sp. RS1-74]|uniref:heavy-metal-associated domain-containing protein n=1 Tax=Sandaracinobacteroides sayramensis TaxID=2913411 RepID=UPI001EDBD4D8|nr:heavy-metal-associated domain-containing protein [Sandaracinobacteroides sayramensis]MCG2842685.1 heavy-metal-associated domain-containing protein [Sandaracinobacteroides sayramensis]
MIRSSSFVAFLMALALAVPGPATAQGLRAADARPGKKAADPGTPTAIGGSGGLVISGVDVDVGGKSPGDARLNGWREAQRQAWPALWARMSGLAPATAPKLADSALDGIVSAIEVEREQVGPDRYVARLAVVFDRVRASSYLGRYANLASSPPFLVIPVLQDAATRQAHEEGSPWLAAWSRLRAGETPIDYVRIRPTPGDVILLNAWQAERRHLFLWRMLIDRYQVADVLIPELVMDRSFSGGPVSGLLIVRFGPAGRELGRVRLSNRAGDVAGLTDAAVREADKLYVAALRAGNLLPDPSLIEEQTPPAELEDTGPQFDAGFEAGAAAQTLSVRVQTPDDATLQSIQRTVAATPGVVGVRLQSLVLGGESTLEIIPAVSLQELRYALDQRGLRLDGTQLRRRAAGETPLAPVVPVGGEAEIEETDAPPPAQGAPKSLLPGGKG